MAQLVQAGQGNRDAHAAGLCRALLRRWPALWTFVEGDSVEPTNNRAERALRPAVLWRRTTSGTRSDAGARFVERLLTVTATCQQHGRSLLTSLTDVCAAALLGQPVPSLLPATTSSFSGLPERLRDNLRNHHHFYNSLPRALHHSYRKELF